MDGGVCLNPRLALPYALRGRRSTQFCQPYPTCFPGMGETPFNFLLMGDAFSFVKVKGKIIASFLTS